jgi:hypothetical protein
MQMQVHFAQMVLRLAQTGPLSEGLAWVVEVVGMWQDSFHTLAHSTLPKGDAASHTRGKAGGGPCFDLHGHVHCLHPCHNHLHSVAAECAWQQTVQSASMLSEEQGYNCSPPPVPAPALRVVNRECMPCTARLNSATCC